MPVQRIGLRTEDFYLFYMCRGKQPETMGVAEAREYLAHRD